MKDGILVAGSALVDHNKFVEHYPKLGMLSQIKETKKQVGGLVSNTGISLKKIDPNLRVGALACLGKDEDGKYLIENYLHYGMDIDNLVTVEDVSTGFTDAITVESTGERTFLTFGGANNILNHSHFNFDSLDYKMAHVGYILLLEQLDAKNEEYGTELAKVLAQLQAKGIKTSIDLVSNETEQFKSIVYPALKYIDYLIINEIEAGLITDISPFETNKIQHHLIEKMMDRIFDLGVKELVVIHSPAGGWAMDRDGNFYHQPSFNLPPGFIKSSVGAGDAFCAGMLYSIYHQYDLNEGIRLANAVAAMSLRETDSISGIVTKDKIEHFIETDLKE